MYTYQICFLYKFDFLDDLWTNFLNNKFSFHYFALSAMSLIISLSNLLESN